MLEDSLIKFKKDTKASKELSLQYDYDARLLSNMGCGGKVFCLARPESISALQYLAESCLKNDIPFHIIGDGTNTLISDRFHQEVFIRLGKGFGIIEKTKKDMIKVGAACGLQRFMVKSADLGRDLSFLSGIPGTVGGAVFCNSGTADEWIGSTVEVIELVTVEGKKTRLKRFGKKDTGFTYRGSGLKEKAVMISFIIKAAKRRKEDILEEIKQNIKRKKKSQPLGSKNLGCFFKNPPDDSTGRLIDKSGFKGFRYGGARISELHANFIENYNNASFEDVISLSNIIKHYINKEHKIVLEPEVRIID